MKICINDDPASTGDAGGYWGFYPDEKHVEQAKECCFALRDEIKKMDAKIRIAWLGQGIEYIGASFFTPDPYKYPSQNAKPDGLPAMKIKVVVSLGNEGKLGVEANNWRPSSKSFYSPKEFVALLKVELLSALEKRIKQNMNNGGSRERDGEIQLKWIEQMQV